MHTPILNTHTHTHTHPSPPPLKVCGAVNVHVSHLRFLSVGVFFLVMLYLILLYFIIFYLLYLLSRDPPRAQPWKVVPVDFEGLTLI